MNNKLYVILVSLIVAMGGFLLGFDASVISGAIDSEYSYTKLFNLDAFWIGFSVSCLSLTSMFAMMVAGPISDRYGRKKVLLVTALLFMVTGVSTAFANNITVFVIGRMIGGFGVGASLLIAPMYIAEIAPPKMRGSMVSLNQLNIVLGITVAYFSNYLLRNIGENDWRWMLGIESIPAVLYFFLLLLVPESPRWLAVKGQTTKALEIMKKAVGETIAKEEFDNVVKSIEADKKKEKLNIWAQLKDLFSPSLRLVVTIAVVIAFFQQATGINAALYYANMIFGQTGVGKDASFAQAVIIGVTNLVFTLIAIWLVDRLGRKPLLLVGLAGMTLSLMVLSFGFRAAEYKITDKTMQAMEIKADAIYNTAATKLQPFREVVFNSDVKFNEALKSNLGNDEYNKTKDVVINNSITINGWLILVAMVGYVAFFAMAIGPIIWVLLSELFPSRIRGVAISVAGFVNAIAAWTVVQIFPWELQTLGNFGTFFIYGALAAVAWLFVLLVLPETKGKSLEEIERTFVGH